MFPINIRSGNNGFYDDGSARTTEEIVECVLYVLLKDCLTKMVEYYAHLGIVNDDTQIDFSAFKSFLKLSTMMFSDTDDINRRVNEAIDRYMIIRNNFDEEMMNLDLDEINIPNEPVFGCNCEMCETMSRVYFEWENWQPNDGFIMLLKISVNRLDVDSLINQI